MKLFILWTTFICSNGEVPTDEMVSRGWIRNMYSSNIYTENQRIKMTKDKIRWQKIYSGGKCSSFLIQEEEVSDQLLLKYILKII